MGAIQGRRREALEARVWGASVGVGVPDRGVKGPTGRESTVLLPGCGSSVVDSPFEEPCGEGPESM
jgi:hypothetical protein